MAANNCLVLFKTQEDFYHLELENVVRIKSGLLVYDLSEFIHIQYYQNYSKFVKVYKCEYIYINLINVK